MDGIVVLDKPSGISSAQAVAKVKKILNNRVGHMGTLDPLASGVLIVGVGKGTKLFETFLEHDKTYIATFTFGYSTDTLDITGQVVGYTDNIPSVDDIVGVLPALCGKVLQVPPQFSAKSVNGVKSYKIARAGGVSQLQPKCVQIYSILYFGQVDGRSHSFEIKCSSGTYIRSICRDMYIKLGSLATMTSLQRTSSGIYSLQSSCNLYNLDESKIITLDIILKDYCWIDLNQACFDKLKNGVRLDTNQLQTQMVGSKPSNIFELVDVDTKIVVKCKGKIFGIGQIVDNKLEIKTNLYSD